MLQTIKTYSEKSKKYNYNGIEFTTNNDGKIMHCEDWQVVFDLEKIGLATHKTYRNCMNHTDYYLN